MLGGGNVVPLTVEWGDPSDGHTPILKKPIRMPIVYFSWHNLSFESDHADYILQLWQNDSLVYETYVESSDSHIELPNGLEGEYELRLVTSTYYYKGYINF